MGPVVGGSPSLPDCGAAVSGTMVARDAGPSTVGLVCPEGELSPQATSHKSGRIQTAMRSLKFKGVFRHYSPVETLAGLPWCLIVLSIGPVPASASSACLKPAASVATGLSDTLQYQFAVTAPKIIYRSVPIRHSHETGESTCWTVKWKALAGNCTFSTLPHVTC